MPGGLARESAELQMMAGQAWDCLPFVHEVRESRTIPAFAFCGFFHRVFRSGANQPNLFNIDQSAESL
jgi:hypothetical protein